MKLQTFVRRLALVLLLATGLVSLTACVPLVVGGAVATGTMVATDRRTSGTVLEDNSIEVKANSRIASNLGERVLIWIR